MLLSLSILISYFFYFLFYSSVSAASKFRHVGTRLLSGESPRIDFSQSGLDSEDSIKCRLSFMPAQEPKRSRSMQWLAKMDNSSCNSYWITDTISERYQFVSRKKKRKTKWLSLMTAIDKSNLKAVTTFLSLAPWKHVSKDSLILRQASKRIPRKCDWGVYVNLTKHAFLTIFLNAFAKT